MGSITSCGRALKTAGRRLPSRAHLDARLPAEVGKAGNTPLLFFNPDEAQHTPPVVPLDHESFLLARL